MVNCEVSSGISLKNLKCDSLIFTSTQYLMWKYNIDRVKFMSHVIKPLMRGFFMMFFRFFENL